MWDLGWALLTVDPGELDLHGLRKGNCLAYGLLVFVTAKASDRLIPLSDQPLLT